MGVDGESRVIHKVCMRLWIKADERVYDRRAFEATERNGAGERVGPVGISKDG